ncbi:MAG: ferrous iron transport protein B [Acutalibacteraceae bacterium]|nr:ferrous iron transport protein B [Acutalibacteraceae bacterium]
MSIKIALAGNPNCGKTTLFNALTGSNQYVGNWPGVTVEKKEGYLKSDNTVTFTDLPGIYSLSPYTPEEVVARDYLVNERPDAILNIVDGTNLERNLYLSTQLMELGIPVVIAVNMMDIVRKNGDKINLQELGKLFRCEAVEISALKGEGINEAAAAAIKAAKSGSIMPLHIFSGTVEHAIAHIEEAAIHNMPEEQQRWYAIKIFERDEIVKNTLKLPPEILQHIEKDIKAVEGYFDDDAESIITNERYLYIEAKLKNCYKKTSIIRQTLSDKIDNIVTNKFLALPIFVLAMLTVYTLAIGTIGDWTVGFMNDTLFGETIIPAVTNWLTTLGCWEWLVSLVSNGIIGGVGAVLGFVPQMLILFLLLSLLEDCGYMSRVAFIMDRLFRKFGLSGKSFIPLLVASGCGVPGIMASRTIDQERDRRMTIITTGFIPCGAKMPIVGLVAGALFGGNPLIATSAYFIGVGAVIISGLMLKKTKPFVGKPAPFVMELPAYHAPLASNVLRTVWERGWSFIKRAGTVILAASVIIWVLDNLSFVGGFHYISGGDEASILNVVGSAIAILFKPLGFGNWQSAVATVLGLMAKEEVVGVFGALSSTGNAEQAFAEILGSPLAGYSFMAFNLLCAPCFAAMGAIRREMNNWKWTAFTITYMCVFAYAVSFCIYQLGLLFMGVGNILLSCVAFGIIAFALFMILRPTKKQLV